MSWDAETRARLEAAPRRIMRTGGPFRIMVFVYEADFDAALAELDRRAVEIERLWDKVADLEATIAEGLRVGEP